MIRIPTRPLVWPVLLLLVALPSCVDPAATDGGPDLSGLECDPDNGGITLPEGFCAIVVADELGRARHLAVDEDGDIYVKLRQANEGGSLVALRDTTADGRADVIRYFGDEGHGGTGIDLHDGYLYYSSDVAVYRQPLAAGELEPSGTVEAVVTGFGDERQHASKSLTIDAGGALFVNVGAPANACQQQPRTEGSPGTDPCPLLERFGGVWRFSAGRPGQTQDADGYRYATGTRNLVALEWNPTDGALFAVQHGRDQLDQLWPDFFTNEDNAELPAEEFMRITDGADFGWPYCYYDQIRSEKVLAPEYGGDGQETGRCADAEDPILAFPGHYAPNDLVFYTASQYPTRFRDGAFVAFHGSWNRAPLPQRGYMVAFVPMQAGEVQGEWEIFADDFDGVEGVLESPGDARYRPTGLAIGPDGSLFIADSVTGRIWRVIHKG